MGRHQTDTALSLRIPLAQSDLPAAQAVLGRQGSFQGRDYRGIEVLANLRHGRGNWENDVPEAVARHIIANRLMGYDSE